MHILYSSEMFLILSLLPSFLLPPWCAVRSYRRHLEVGNSIWGDDWSYSPFIRLSPSWGCLGFSSAIRQMPGDPCTGPRIIQLSPLSLATDVTDATFGASVPWLGTRTGAGGTAKLTESLFFWPQPVAPWTTCIHQDSSTGSLRLNNQASRTLDPRGVTILSLTPSNIPCENVFFKIHPNAILPWMPRLSLQSFVTGLLTYLLT